MKTRLHCLALTLSVLGTAALADGISLTVEGIRNNKGNVLVLVFDDARAFDTLSWQYAVDYAEIPARPGHVSHRFPDLNDGPYAIFLFHDENGDEDLNYEGERLLEGVGASGAPQPDDYPGFREAAFAPGPVTVRMHYDQ